MNSLSFFKYIFLFFLFISFSIVCNSKQPLDSVDFYIQKLKKTPIGELTNKSDYISDFQKIAIYYLLGIKHYEMQNFEKSRVYFEWIVENQKQKISDVFLYRMNVNIALCEKKLGNFEHSIVFFSIAQHYIQSTNDSIEKTLLIYDIGETYFEWGKYDLAGEYLQRLEILLKKNNQTDLLIETYIKLGAIAQKMNLSQSAISYFEKAKKISQKNKQSENYVNSLINLAIEYISTEKFEKAGYLLDEARNISQKINYTRGLIYSQKQIAQLFVAKNDFLTALIFLQQSKNLITQTTDTETKLIIYSNIATVYKLMKEYQKALFYFEKQNELYLKIGLSTHKIQNMLQLAEVHKLLKNYSLAEKYIDSCMIFSLDLKEKNFIEQARFQMAEIFMLQNKYSQAENVLMQLIQTEDSIIDQHLKSGIYLRTAELYKAKNMHVKSLFYYEKYYTLQLNTIKKANTFELNKLQTESKIGKLSDDLQKTKLSNQLKEKQLSYKNKLVVFLSLSGILFIVLSLMLGKLYIEKNNSYKELIKRNIELAEQIPFKAEKILVEKHFLQKNDKYAELIASLIKLFDKESIYMQSDISLQKVAELLNTNRTYLSSAIQEVLSTNFPNLINKYRIEKARKLLAEDSQKLSIEGIALSVGFNSKSTFNTAFKKFTGVTPSEMRSQNEN